MNNPAKISVCIIVKNAQATIKECLESLKEFDEIILLDNGSTDATLQIAQDFNATYGRLRVEQSEFIGFGALKNLCVSYAKNEWILSLDSDEVLESSALSAIKAQNLQPQNIYAISRKNLYKGEWIKACGWSPDFVWRLFNKNFTRFNENIVHESVIIPPNAQKIRLQGHIKHYACSGLAQIFEKTQKYSTLYAKEHANKHSTPLKAFIHGFFCFVRDYFFRKGIFYGYKGFVISLCNALGTFSKYIKIYENNQNDKSHRNAKN